MSFDMRCGGAVTVRADQYKANAELCQRASDKATGQDAKAAWLLLAQSWMVLVQGEERLEAAWSGLLQTDWPEPSARNSRGRH